MKPKVHLNRHLIFKNLFYVINNCGTSYKMEHRFYPKFPLNVSYQASSS